MGTSMSIRFISKRRLSDTKFSVKVAEGRVANKGLPLSGITRGPLNSAPVPVMITTLFSRSRPKS